MIRPGEPWGKPAEAGPDLTITGSDADLAAAVAQNPGRLIRYSAESGSDLARAIGTDRGADGGLDVPFDALRLDGEGEWAVNMVVVGTPPDRLGRFSRRFGTAVAVDGREIVQRAITTLVVATGEFLRGHDVVPRGHPGDGRAEIQAYAVDPGERRALRSRLQTGTHVPHPAIRQATARSSVVCSFEHRVPVEIDGRPSAPAAHLAITVVPAAYRLLL